MIKKYKYKQEYFQKSAAIIRELKRVNFYIGGERYYDAIKVLDYLINTHKLDKLRMRIKLLNETKEKKDAITGQSN